MRIGFTLTIIKGAEAGKKFSLRKSTVNLGRSAVGNDIILNDISVSSAHARITYENGRYFIQDLGSKNYTFVQGEPLEEGRKVRLEEAVIPAAAAAGFVPELVMINAQEFTKTANCWGVANNKRGTNTNRIVVLRRA